MARKKITKDDPLSPAAEALHDTLVAAIQAPEPTDWRTLYGPTEIAAYSIELDALEAELDHGWPEWRVKKPFTEVSREKLIWIKLRLKRRDLIINGHGSYGVAIVDRGEARPIVVPVRPSKRRADAPVYRPVVTEAMICHELSARPAAVREALEAMPAGQRDAVGWVRNFLLRRAAPPSDAVPLEPSGEASTSSETTEGEA